MYSELLFELLGIFIRSNGVDMRILFLSFWLALLSLSFVYSQEPDSTGTPGFLAGEIKATARLNSKEVAQNRTVTYTVEIRWSGDLDRYEIKNVGEPVLTNLDILGSSSSNWVGDVDGMPETVKSYEYILKPSSLGMAYVDGTTIQFEDKKLDRAQTLMTNRLQIKVTDPIPDRDTRPFVIIAGSLIILAGLGVFGLMVLRRRRLAAERQMPGMLTKSFEEEYLSELKEAVDPNESNSDDAFATLSRLFRRYLSDRYEIPALGASTPEILEQLRDKLVSDKIISESDEVLRTCDLAKFSGSALEQGKLARVYTMIEDILTRNNSEYIEFSNNKLSEGANK